MALTEGPNILLDKPILLLGRHQECDIQLASRKISRRHCCIAQVNDYLVVRDLCSTNGIRINGVRVTEGCLKPGDELTLGNHRYQVQWHAQPGEPIPSRDVVPALPGKEAVRRTRHAPFEEDDPLESCEDPVPLAEPAHPGHRAIPVAPAMKPAPAPNPVILPDNLELAPLSEVIPPPDKPPEAPA
jgi:predicted component of type VI protein secretion system